MLKITLKNHSNILKHRSYVRKMFIAILFTVWKNQKQAKLLTIRKLRYIHYMNNPFWLLLFAVNEH